jgi:hypothetical protein
MTFRAVTPPIPIARRDDSMQSLPPTTRRVADMERIAAGRVDEFHRELSGRPSTLGEQPMRVRESTMRSEISPGLIEAPCPEGRLSNARVGPGQGPSGSPEKASGASKGLPGHPARGPRGAREARRAVAIRPPAPSCPPDTLSPAPYDTETYTHGS